MKIFDNENYIIRSDKILERNFREESLEDRHRKYNLFKDTLLF